MHKPNCFIVGAAKAGTTSLFHYFEQSNQIYISNIKEPNYFCTDILYKNFRKSFQNDIAYNPDPLKYKKHAAWIDDLEIYKKLFPNKNGIKLYLEGSVSYLYSKKAANNIFNFNPNSKIVIILRNPIERAFSHYLMNLQIGYAKDTFINEVLNDYNQKDKSWGKTHLYIELGLYYEQVKRYLDFFPNKQVKIIFFEDIQSNLQEILNSTCDFLEIRNIRNFDNKIYNKSTVPRYPVVFSWLKKVYKKFSFFQNEFLKKKIKRSMLSTLNRPSLSKKDRDILHPYFKSDIEKLSNLLDVNLDHWLSND